MPGACGVFTEAGAPSSNYYALRLRSSTRLESETAPVGFANLRLRARHREPSARVYENDPPSPQKLRHRILPHALGRDQRSRPAPARIGQLRSASRLPSGGYADLDDRPRLAQTKLRPAGLTMCHHTSNGTKMAIEGEEIIRCSCHNSPKKQLYGAPEPLNQRIFHFIATCSFPNLFTDWAVESPPVGAWKGVAPSPEN